VGQLYLRRNGVEINNKNTVRSFVKIVAKRMALMPDEDFEGDFFEVQENNHGITTLQVRFDPKSSMKM
jgi:hypothetical protein